MRLRITHVYQKVVDKLTPKIQENVFNAILVMYLTKTENAEQIIVSCSILLYGHASNVKVDIP